MGRSNMTLAMPAERPTETPTATAWMRRPFLKAPAAASAGLMKLPLRKRMRPRLETMMTGQREARVTMPKPLMPVSDLPRMAETPSPRVRTSGTVTGPVVTAPVSQARAWRGFRGPSDAGPR